MKAVGIDIKLIELGRWYIPRTSDIVKYEGALTFAGFGHYNFIDIKNVEEKETKVYPMIQAYNTARHVVSFEQQDFTSQRLMAFANLYDEGIMTREWIDQFWDARKMDLLYMTMIHPEENVGIGKVYDEINRLFSGCQYVVYLTFDYSSMILFARNMSFSDYLNRIYEMNFVSRSDDSPYGVKDTFSVYGINRNILKDVYEKKPEELKCMEHVKRLNECGGKFHATVNVSIQKLDAYLKLKQGLKNANLEFVDWKMFGRHDMSIMGTDVDLIWLFSVYRVFHEILTQMDPDSAFFTYEVFVRTPASPERQESALNDRPENEDKGTKNSCEDIGKYHSRDIIAELSTKYNEMSTALKDIHNKNEYLRPIEEVIRSIKSISKNRFAEDFILCMYESFTAFMDFVGKYALQEKKFFRDSFIQFFGEYFHCLNSLISSAMHDDRQFIQITAFNAVFFDVPPKMMAFYTAMTWRLQNIMRGADEKHYYYLFTPYFTDDISVALISQAENAPADRIFSVRMNEKQLYNPQLVVRSMAHEIAHDVGDDKRLRPQRKMLMAKTVIYMYLSRIWPECFAYDDLMKQLIVDVYEYFCRIWKEDDKDYLDHVREWLGRCFNIICDGEILDRIYEYVLTSVRYMQEKNVREWNDYAKGLLRELDDKSNCSNFFMRMTDRKTRKSVYVKNLEFQLCWNRIWEGLKPDENSVRCWYGIIEEVSSIYRETYADLQMILLLNMSYCAYLECFLYDSDLDVKEWGEHREDVMRITAVCRLMEISGFWNAEIPEEMEEEGLQELKDFSQSIQACIEKDEITFEEDIPGYRDKLREKVKDYRNSQGDMACLWHPERKRGTDSGINMEYITSQCIPEIDNLVHLYLLECMEKSVDCYMERDKNDLVKAVQSTMRCVGEFSDIDCVFEEIRKVIGEYKEYLQ